MDVTTLGLVQEQLRSKSNHRREKDFISRGI
jgi:hypothetical protein